MRMIKIFEILTLLSLSTCTQLALASQPSDHRSPQKFEALVTRSLNWKQLFAATGKSVSPLFKEEFSKEAQNLAFPSVSFRQSKIVFRDENGNHISVDLQKHGKIFLNDQAFEIRPLDSLAKELDRLESEFSHVRATKNFFDYLFPTAVAAISGRGVALAAYATSSGWTAEQCGSANLSAEQIKSCPQTAAPMQIAYQKQDSDKFFPVELVCPSTEPNGTLDLISRNSKGVTNRMRVVYSNYNPKSVEGSVALPGETLHRALFVNLDSKNDPVSQDWANELAAKSNSIKTNVCEGPVSNRQRYLAALAKNKSIFINRSRDQDSNEDSDSGSTQQAL